jgi:Flp pilus assembly pilin Flp
VVDFDRSRTVGESFVSCARGVTAIEYALVLAALAFMVYGTYLVLGSSVSSLANSVDSTLTAASRRAAGAEATPKPKP